MRQYQVALLGVKGAPADTFRARLVRRFEELEIDLQLLSFLDLEADSNWDRTAPIVGVYFGPTTSPLPASDGLKALVADGHVVVPVVPHLCKFSEYVPPELRLINGHEPKSADVEYDELCGVVLENLSLLRKSRRIFISYRQKEARQVAIQLYEELDRRTFDVFLDTLAIRPGEPFQEVLWHRLADTDVMVLLDSPGFMESRWTEAELARANSTSLQILQVIWPGHAQSADAAFSVPYQLEPSDFANPGVQVGDDASLVENVIDGIALQAEGLRARALAARHSYLVQEMFREAEDVGLPIHAQPGRFLEMEDAKRGKAIIVPTVGVPDAIRHQEIEEELATDPDAQLLLVFDERGVRDRWLKHLNWLRPLVRVKSLAIAEVKAWLAARVAT